MTRMTVRAGTLVLATLLATGTGAAGAPVTLDAARRAVEATLDMIPADDIHVKTGTGGPLAHHCPPTGKHRWRYRWAPGQLIRLDGA